MSIYKKFTKDVFVIGLINALGFFRGIIVLPIITKFLGALNYGIWAQLSTTINLTAAFIVLGLPFALVRFLAAEKDKKEIQEGVYSVFASVGIIALVTALFLAMFSGWIAGFFQCDPLLIKVLGLIIIFECLNAVNSSIFMAFQETKKYAFFIVVQLIGEVGLTALAVLLGYGLYGIVISLLLVQLLVFLLSFYTIVKKIGIKIPTFSQIKKYLFFGFPTVITNFSYWAVSSADRYLINLFMGVIFVGYYAPAYSIGAIMNILIYPIGLVLFFSLPKIFDENKITEVKNVLKYSLKFFLLIAIPSAFGLSVLAKQLLVIFSTKEIADNAYFVVPFIVASIFLYGVCYFFNQILVLAKKTKLIAVIWAIAAALNVMLNIIFFFRFGILAAGITTLAAYTCAVILMGYFAGKHLQLEINWLFILKSILSSAVMALFIVYVNPSGLLNMLAAIAASVFIYGILILLLKGINEKEIQFLKNIVRSSEST